MAALDNALSRAVELPVTVVEPRAGLSLRVGELWGHRELLAFLVWRDVKVRYKQTLLGVGWAVIQPLALMVVFTLIFGRVADIPSEGVPYAVFVLCGLVLWNYFSAALAAGGGSLVANTNLITKVYFPRLVIPLAALMVPLVDLAISLGLLAVVMALYGVTPGVELLVAPAFAALAVLAALGVSLGLSALNVRYRDVRYALPFLIQLGLYATPVVYPVTVVPEAWRWLLALNPMTAAVQGFRWSLVGGEAPAASTVALGLAVAAAALVGGLIYFRRVERGFADVI